MTHTPAQKLEVLNAFRAADGKPALKDWRETRHMPMLTAYREAQEALQDFEMSEGERASQVGRESADIARDEALLAPKVEVKVKGAKRLKPGVHTAKITEVTADEKGVMKISYEVVKAPSYKEMPRHAKSQVEKPFVLVHAFLDANPTLTRKQAVAALVEQGVNFYTARTQYQRWFSKRK